MILFHSNLLSCLIISIISVNFIKCLGNQHFNHYHEEWCEYLQKFPEEPFVVIYPRIPKCGSSTIDFLMHQILTKHNGKFLEFPSDLWGYDDNNKIFEGIKEMINTELSETDHSNRTVPTVLAGHIPMIDWERHIIPEPVELVNHTPHRREVETIQFMRECREQQISQYFYKLFQIPMALEAAKQNRLSEYQHSTTFPKAPLTGPDHTFDHDACFKDYNCLKNSTGMFHPDGKYLMTFLCGKKCLDDHQGKIEEGAIKFFTHPKYFLNVGDLSTIDQFLEMLECNYPNSFDGIANYYKELTEKNEAVRNPTGDAKKREYSEAFERIVEETCDPKTNEYAKLYHELFIPLIKDRYEFMKANKQRCCRKLSPTH